MMMGKLTLDQSKMCALVILWISWQYQMVFFCCVMLCGFDFHTDELKMCTLVVIVVAMRMRVPNSGFCYVDLTDWRFFVPFVVQI